MSHPEEFKNNNGDSEGVGSEGDTNFPDFDTEPITRESVQKAAKQIAQETIDFYNKYPEEFQLAGREERNVKKIHVRRLIEGNWTQFQLLVLSHDGQLIRAVNESNNLGRLFRYTQDRGDAGIVINTHSHSGGEYPYSVQLSANSQGAYLEEYTHVAGGPVLVTTYVPVIIDNEGADNQYFFVPERLQYQGVNLRQKDIKNVIPGERRVTLGQLLRYTINPVLSDNDGGESPGILSELDSSPAFIPLPYDEDNIVRGARQLDFGSGDRADILPVDGKDNTYLLLRTMGSQIFARAHTVEIDHTNFRYDPHYQQGFSGLTVPVTVDGQPLEITLRLEYQAGRKQIENMSNLPLNEAEVTIDTRNGKYDLQILQVLLEQLSEL